MKVLDLAMRFENDGVAAIVYTDIDRDGAMQGVNVDATVDLAFALTTPVIVGGVRGISDLADLKENESAGIEGLFQVARSTMAGWMPTTLELLRN